MITIIILLILSIVTINFIGGKNGILLQSKNAQKLYSEQYAREKLELTLATIVSYKYTNEDKYNDMYLTEKLLEEGYEVNDDIVIVDGWQFEIDRELIQIKQGLSEGEINSEIYNEGLIGKLSTINSTGYYDLDINGIVEDEIESKTYNINAIVYNGDLVLDGVNEIQGAILNNGVYEFGDETKDVATSTENAKSMVVLKVTGNLTINADVILTTCKSQNGYGGPKGLYIYCLGALNNYGKISMTARGAKAVGENVYLWKNNDESWEYIPAVGAKGGESLFFANNNTSKHGNDGTNRQTGGGTGSGRIV